MNKAYKAEWKKKEKQLSRRIKKINKEESFGI
jgi:hypothetical protein